MKTTTALSLSFMTMALASCDHKDSGATGQRPNVIFIYADDMGKGMISAYGQPYVKTPNMDQLIRQGVSFTNAYGCMLSAPARASLLTGYNDCGQGHWRITRANKYAVNVADTAVIAPLEKTLNNSRVQLPAGDFYLPQVFQKAGYTTAQIGKLEYGFVSTRDEMKAHGWDYYYGYLDHVRCHGFYPPFLFENGAIVPIEGNTRANCGKTMEPETPEAYADRHNLEGKAVYSQDLFLEKIIQFIRDHKDGPFFLFHPTQLPHGPVSVPEVDPSLESIPQLTPIEKEYATMVKILDRNIGVIMDELRALGIEQQTLIVFASDNGHEIYYGQSGRCEKPYKNMTTGQLFDDYTDKYYSTLSGDVFNGNADMAGLKRSNLEGGVRVPLAFYWPGHIQPRESHQVVAMYDLLPTFAQWLGVSLPSGKDGVSLYPLLQASASAPSDTTLADDRYVAFSSFIGPALVRNDGWKLRYYAPTRTYELYQLCIDPQERNPLTDNYPDLVAILKEQLLRECNGNIENGIYRD